HIYIYICRTTDTKMTSTNWLLREKKLEPYHSESNVRSTGAESTHVVPPTVQRENRDSPLTRRRPETNVSSETEEQGSDNDEMAELDELRQDLQRYETAIKNIKIRETLLMKRQSDRVRIERRGRDVAESLTAADNLSQQVFEETRPRSRSPRSSTP